MNHAIDRCRGCGARLVNDEAVLGPGAVAKIFGVSRRTIYNWLSSGKIEYVRTAGGSVRIFVDTLWRDPNNSDRPAVQTMWQAEGRNQA